MDWSRSGKENISRFGKRRQRYLFLFVSCIYWVGFSTIIGWCNFVFLFIRFVGLYKFITTTYYDVGSACRIILHLNHGFVIFFINSRGICYRLLHGDFVLVGLNIQSIIWIMGRWWLDKGADWFVMIGA